MRIFTKIDGASRTVAKLAVSKKVLKEAALIAMNQAASSVARRAKEILVEKRHVITGNLRRSITSKAYMKSDMEVEGIIGSGVDYAPYVEALPDGGYLYAALMQEGAKALIIFKAKLMGSLQGIKGM